MAEHSPKRILYVENGIGYGGAIICLRHLVRNLDPAAFEAMVVTGRTGPEYRTIALDAQWRHITDHYIDVVRIHRELDPASWPDRLPGLRFVINQILARADDLANFLPFFLRLLWTAKQFKADLIHTNNEPLCNRASLLAGKLLGIPTVAHVRGNQQGSRLMQWAYSLADFFIPVSHWIAASMQEKLSIPLDKIHVVYDGIELEKLELYQGREQFRSTYHLHDDDFAVGLVGLLIPWKGQQLFLDAAHLLKERIPKLKMLIIGGTPDDCVGYEKTLKTRVQEEGLSDWVIFTGHLNGMAAAYNGLDIVVSASTGPEPLGTVVIETMTLARPLVGPNHGGAAEMMEHNVTGLLFEPGNAQDLADKIETFYRDAELRQRLGDAARKKALQTFSVATHVDQIQNIYNTLLNS